MPRTWGNTMRPSTARDDGKPISNLPGLYPIEDWVVHYWDVDPRGGILSRQVSVQLPFGYASVCPAVAIGQRGCVHRVRRWGVQCYSRTLQDIGFDPSALLRENRERFPGGDDEQMVSILIHATHFDLPSHFVIASLEHPLLLFDPQGILKGSYTRWHTHLGALAYIVSAGERNAYFGRLHAENPSLYEQALRYLLKALRGPKAQ